MHSKAVCLVRWSKLRRIYRQKGVSSPLANYIAKLGGDKMLVISVLYIVWTTFMQQSYAIIRNCARVLPTKSPPYRGVGVYSGAVWTRLARMHHAVSIGAACLDEVGADAPWCIPTKTRNAAIRGRRDAHTKHPTHVGMHHGASAMRCAFGAAYLDAIGADAPWCIPTKMRNAAMRGDLELSARGYARQAGSLGHRRRHYGRQTRIGGLG